MYKLYKNFYRYRALFLGLSITSFIVWRFNKNFNEFERAMSKEQGFDLRRASQQLNIYRELYDPENDLKDRQSGPSKLLSVASEEDKLKMKNIFKKYENLNDADEIKKQISNLKTQLDLLEERKTAHQGIKLSRVLYGYEPSEEALKKIREHYKENKKSSKE